MDRRYERVHLKPADLTFLYPKEITERLEGLSHACGIIPQDEGAPLPEGQRLPALDQIQEALLSRTEPLLQNYGRLPIDVRQHLKYLLYSSRQAAESLQRSQPDTPLGFPKGPKGVLANLLHASWVDLTHGGKLHVDFSPLDDKS